MCLRRLEVSRDVELFKKLHRFAESVVGKPYGFTFSKLLAARSIRSVSTSPKPSRDGISKRRSQSECTTSDMTSSADKSTMSSTSSGGDIVEPTKHFDDTTFNRSSYCDHSGNTSESSSLSKRERIKKFLRARRIYKSDRKRSFDDSTESPAGDAVIGSAPEAEDDSEATEFQGLDSFFCSELVAAALQEMDLIPRSLNVSAFWPGSFIKGGDVDKNMFAESSYGEWMSLVKSDYQISC